VGQRMGQRECERVRVTGREECEQRGQTKDNKGERARVATLTKEMEILLEKSETFFFNAFYNSTIPQNILENYFYKESNTRIFTTIFILEMVGVNILYFLGSGFSWYFLFDKNILLDKKILPNQVLY
jgi:hypothetical protein